MKTNIEKPTQLIKKKRTKENRGKLINGIKIKLNMYLKDVYKTNVIYDTKYKMAEKVHPRKFLTIYL